jgi:hypothetical protein
LRVPLFTGSRSETSVQKLLIVVLKKQGPGRE